jgi:hypothetical protein
VGREQEVGLLFELGQTKKGCGQVVLLSGERHWQIAPRRYKHVTNEARCSMKPVARHTISMARYIR